MAQSGGKDHAFGDDSNVSGTFYVTHPRHIEFQILADEYGNVVHLGERDCSIQRNHQKMIEESPCPIFFQRKNGVEMGETAVRAARAAGYVNAGTSGVSAGKKWDILFYGNEYKDSGGASGHGVDHRD